MTAAVDILFRNFIRTWINDKLDQGDSAESVIESMTDGGFEENAAAQAVHVSLGGDVSSTYQYDPSPVPSGRIFHIQDRTIRALLRVEQPQLILFDSVLSADECDRIIELSKERMRPSSTTDPAIGDFTQPQDSLSESCTFGLSETSFIDRIDQRISALMNCPLENGEGLQVMHYGTGGHYRHHFDFLPPGDSTTELIRGGQRTATLIVYLNEVEAGGVTNFPRAGIKFTPRKGQAVYFRYLNDIGQLDPATEHAGLPVDTGEKWILNKRMRRYGSSFD
ncbi:2OG-Fe(II) oxygenase [Nocardia sp. NPDC003963]